MKMHETITSHHTSYHSFLAVKDCKKLSKSVSNVSGTVPEAIDDTLYT